MQGAGQARPGVPRRLERSRAACLQGEGRGGQAEGLALAAGLLGRSVHCSPMLPLHGQVPGAPAGGALASDQSPRPRAVRGPLRAEVTLGRSLEPGVSLCGCELKKRERTQSACS